MNMRWATAMLATAVMLAAVRFAPAAEPAAPAGKGKPAASTGMKDAKTPGEAAADCELAWAQAELTASRRIKPLPGPVDKPFILSGCMRWWIADLNGSARVNTDGQAGSYADYVDDLGLKTFNPRNRPGIFDFNLEGRTGGARLLVDYLETSVTGDTFVERLVFGGREYADEYLRTEMRIKLIHLSFGLDLTRTPPLTLTFVAGAGYLDYSVSVGADPLSPSGSSSRAGGCPFPNVGGRGVFTFSRNFEALADFRLSTFYLGDLGILIVDSSLGIRFRPVRFVSAGVGLRFFYFNGRGLGTWSSGDTDDMLVTLGGPYFEIEGRF